jgi:hypothetical protein
MSALGPTADESASVAEASRNRIEAAEKCRAGTAGTRAHGSRASVETCNMAERDAPAHTKKRMPPAGTAVSVPKLERGRRKAAGTPPRELAASLERKEILELFSIFEASATARPVRPPLGRAAASNAVAPATTFEAVLRASYPKADGVWIARMLRLVRTEQRALARRAWMARARDLEPEILRLFGHIDRNGSRAAP